MKQNLGFEIDNIINHTTHSDNNDTLGRFNSFIIMFTIVSHASALQNKGVTPNIEY